MITQSGCMCLIEKAQRGDKGQGILGFSFRCVEEDLSVKDKLKNII